VAREGGHYEDDADLYFKRDQTMGIEQMSMQTLTLDEVESLIGGDLVSHPECKMRPASRSGAIPRTTQE
jgi:hypothetical protein